MNTAELSALIHEASTGDIDSYLTLYRAVYKPLYKIAAMALTNKEHAVRVVLETASDGFTALPVAGISQNASFVEWIVKILCTKIRHIYKSEPQQDKKENEGAFDMQSALGALPDIERLVLAVSTVCGCSAEKTAKLCGYTVETVSVCLTNAEVTLKTLMLIGSEQA